MCWFYFGDQRILVHFARHSLMGIDHERIVLLIRYQYIYSVVAVLL